MLGTFLPGSRRDQCRWKWGRPLFSRLAQALAEDAIDLGSVGIWSGFPDLSHEEAEQARLAGSVLGRLLRVGVDHSLDSGPQLVGTDGLSSRRRQLSGALASL